jgi:predicted acyltransferase
MKPERIGSIDAYRGFVMLVLVLGNTWVFRQQAKLFPESRIWEFLGNQFSHSAWTGCTFWDLTMPSFLFLVGLSMPFSYSKRLQRRQNYIGLLGHAIYRSVVLVLLGIYLSSPFALIKDMSLNNVLVQIGLGYSFAFLVLRKKSSTQLFIALGILIIFWGAFAIYPLPTPNPEYLVEGIQKDHNYFTGFFAHWDINTNLGASFDQWFLNLFPRERLYRPSVGDNESTLIFIPCISTMIFGMMTGEFLRSNNPPKRVFKNVIAIGVGCIILGLFLGQTLCPIVKSIWTPSWTIYSTGWTLCMFAFCFWLIDIRGYRSWAFPFLVVGMNSITIYCMSMIGGWWFLKYWKIFLGPTLFEGSYGLIWAAIAVVFSLWLVCLILYRIRLFVRI